MWRNFLLFTSLFVFANILFSDTLSKNEISYKKITNIRFNLKYHKPEYLLKNAINGYSIVHFIDYFILSLFRFVNLRHVVFISITWEIIELFISSDWARESWANKICDLICNLFGFYIPRKFLFK